MKFRKKPVVIEALQLRWDNWNEMCDFAGVGALTDGKPVGTMKDQDGKALPEGADWYVHPYTGGAAPCKAERLDY